MASVNCFGTENILTQRRKSAFYNVPLIRFNLISPYPQFTKKQLDMRRKVEILKYSNSSSNTKTNNLTKNQTFAQLVNGGIKTISQYGIKTSKSVLQTEINDQLPTLTSSCDVPGPVMVLQLDPSVPLYNYVTDINRSYPYQNLPSTTIYNQYTTNFTSFIETNAVTLPSDITKSVQTRFSPIGVIIVKENNNVSRFNTFTISTPIAMWVNFVYGVGLTNANGEDITQPQFLLDSDVISIKISSIDLNVSFNERPFIPLSTPVISSNMFLENINLSFNGSDIPVGQSYGLQYVGTLNIKNLQLPSSLDAIYDLGITVSYNVYVNGILINNNFDFFQSGIFTNVTFQDRNVVTPGFSFRNNLLDYKVGSFASFGNALAPSNTYA
jgi:hypothetical protein